MNQQSGGANTVRVGALLSGRGSNLAALLRHQKEGYFSRARLVCAASDNPAAPGLGTATQAGLSVHAKSVKSFSSKTEYEAALIAFLRNQQVDWLVLAGYMRLVGPAMLDAFPGRILNIHPSLLPSFPGLHAQRQALEHGVCVSGCTVHFVDAGLDSGPIIGQRAVPVLAEDTEETLSERILMQEHQLYAECLRRVTESHYEIIGRRVVFHQDHIPGRAAPAS